ncbi:hypothetical protein [Sphingomonas changbaiensis]|uniref:hypothetical protein n=1 Tax=Sphingomonas changbaiensis TaxID=529705 RepID=UPI0012ED16DC|nr:hypothetical protein [Sphingomonas changbaiensis]
MIPLLNDRQAEVFASLEGARPMTNAEIALKLGWTINRVTPRVLELRTAGVVKDFGKRACSVTGRKAYIWAAAEHVVKEKLEPTVEYVEIDGVMHARVARPL